MSSDVDHRYSSRYWVREEPSNGARSQRLNVIASRLAGALTAAFLLVGRWEPARGADGTYVTGRQVDFYEPRFLIAAALAVVVSSLPLTRHRKRHPDRRRGGQPQRVALVLGFFLVLSFAWSIERPFAAAKASEIVLLGCVAVLFGAAAVGVHGRFARDAFWVSLITASGLLGIMGAYQIVAAGSGSTNRYAVAPLGGGPNVFGRNMAVLTVALFVLILSQRIPRSISLPAAAVSGLLVILSGSRGALLALAVGVVVAVLSTRPRARTLVFTTIMVLLTLAFVGWSTTIVDRAGIVLEQRLSISNIEDQFRSSRATPYQEGIACFAEYPIAGAGLGGFAALNRQYSYPHNILLEIACEGGSIGVFLSLWVLLPALTILWKARSFLDPLPLAVLAVAFVAALFSGDLFDSRGLVIFGILALGLHQPTSPVDNRQEGKQAAAFGVRPARNSNAIDEGE